MNTFDLLKYFGCKSSPKEEAEIREWLANDPDGSHLKKYKDARYIFEGMTLYGDETKAERTEAVRRPGIFKVIFRKFLADLPEMSLNIFLSSRFEDLTYEEIARKYGVTPRKVKREIQKALEKLRGSLKDYLPVLLLMCLH